MYAKATGSSCAAAPCAEAGILMVMEVVDLASPLLQSGIPTLDEWHDFASEHPDAYAQYRFGTLPHGTEQHPSFVGGCEPAVQEIDQVKRFGDEIESTVAEILGTKLDLTVVIMIGASGSNGFSGTYRGKPAVFLCPEFTFLDQGLRVLLAHEFAHAAHETVLAPARVRSHDRDALFGAWFEGLAVEVSSRACPGRPEHMYFWFGLEGFEEWPAQCAARRGSTEAAVRDGDYVSAFAGGTIDDVTRTGYWLGRRLVIESGLTITEAAGLAPRDVRARVLAMVS